MAKLFTNFFLTFLISLTCASFNNFYGQPAEIGDFVWYDDNNNGIQEAGEVPYVNIRVWLYAELTPGNYTLVGQTITNASGFYSFTSANAVLSANTSYFVVVKDVLLEPGTSNPVEPTLRDVGDDNFDSDGSIAPAIFTPFAGLPYAQFDSGTTTIAVNNIDFGFYTLCSDLDVSLPTSINACEGETLNLTAVTTGGTAPIGYDWDDGTSNTSNTLDYRVFASEVFGVTVTDAIGCTATASININVERCPLDLSINKKHDPSIISVNADDPFTFEIEICNEGESSVDSVEIYDIFPSGYILDDTDWTVINSNTTFSTANIELSISNGFFPSNGLMPGTCQSVFIDMIIDACAGSDNLDNVALINFQRDIYGFLDDEDSTPSSAILDEDDTDNDGAPVFDLAMRKILLDGIPPFKVNDEIVFAIDVHNQGNVPATGVRIIDYLPEGFTFGAGNSDWAYSAISHTAIGTIPGTIAPGTSVQIPLTLLIDGGDSIEDWTNIAEILSASDNMGNDMTGLDFDSTNDNDPSNDVGGVPNTASDNEINDNGQNKDGDAVTDEDDHDAEMINIFDLALKKELTTPEPYFYGQDHSFDITVCNQGNMVASDIQITDYVPSGYTFSAINNTPTWTASGTNAVTTTMTQLAPGECEVIQISLTLEAATTGVADWVNYAEITAASDAGGNDMNDNDLDSTPGSDSDAENMVQPDDPDDDNIDGNGPIVGEDEDDHDPAGPRIIDVALRKTTTATGPFAYGDMITFDIEVFNQGNEIVQDLELIDYLPCGLEYVGGSQLWSASGTNYVTTLSGQIMPGSSQTLTIDVRVVQCLGDPNAWLNAVEITKIEDADNLDISDLDLDSDLDNDNSNDAGGSANDPSDNEIYGDGSGTPGSADADTDEDDHDIELIEVFDLALTKELGTTTPVPYGGTAGYIITIYNQGNVPATDIEITDYIPAGFTFDPTNGFNVFNGWVGAGNPTVTIAGPLLPNSSIQRNIFLTLQRTSGGEGDWDNYAEINSADDDDPANGLPVDADSTPGSNTATENEVMPGDLDDNNIEGGGPSEGEDEDDHDPADIRVIDVALRKTTTATGPFTYGQDITFSIEVFNQGNEIVQDVEIIDYLPCGLEYQGGSQPWSASGTDYIATLPGQIMPGSSQIITIDVQVVPCTDGTENPWLNAVEITRIEDMDNIDISDLDMDSDLDSDPANDGGGAADTDSDDEINGNGSGTPGSTLAETDEDDHDIELIEIFDLALTKELGSVGPFSYGNTAGFVITIYNQGNVPATDVEITDYLPAGFSFDATNAFNMFNGWSGTTTPTTTIAGPIMPNTSIQRNIFLTIEQTAGGMTDWDNYAEISRADDDDSTNGLPVDADSTPDAIDGNDNDVIPEDPDDDNIDGGGLTVGEDEDDHDPARIEIIDLALRKTETTAGAYRYGDMVCFDVTVFNQGNTKVATTKVIDYFPEGLVSMPSNFPQWTTGLVPNSLVTEIKDIDPGESKTSSLCFTLSKTEGGLIDWDNCAEIYYMEDEFWNNLIDIDSSPDDDPSNDIGGSVNTDEDNHVDDNGNDLDGDGIRDEDDHDCERIELFDLALQKEIISNSEPQYGEEVVFRITVFNQGNTDAYDIDIIDYVPVGFTYDPSSPTNISNGWSTASNPVSNLPGPLFPGLAMTRDIALIFEMTDGGEGVWDNYAEIASGDNDANPANGGVTDIDSNLDNNSANDNQVEPGSEDDNKIDGCGPLAGEDEDDHDVAGFDIVDLALTKKSITPGPYAVGQTVVFEIEVYNQGNVPVDEISVIDYIPSGFSYSGINFPQWLYDPFSGNTITTINGPILPGDSEIVEINLILEYTNDYVFGWDNYAEIYSFEDTNDNNITNLDIDSNGDFFNNNDAGGLPNSDADDEEDGDGTGSVGDGVAETDEDDHDPERIEIIDLALRKTLNTAGPYTYGQTLEFEITIFNQGNEGATNVEITDYIPPGYILDPSQNITVEYTDYLGNSTTGGALNWAYNPGLGEAIITLDDMVTTGGTATFTFDLVIQQTTGGEKDWFNYAEISHLENEDGEDRDLWDLDSVSDSNNNDENFVEPNELNDDNIESHDKGGEEDDHDPAGIEIYDLALRKTIANRFGPYEYGDLVTFTFDIFNQGSIESKDIEISDYIPCGFKYDPSNDFNGWSYDTATGIATYTISPVLTPGSTTSASIVLEVQQCIDNSIETFTNYAEISNSVSNDPDEPAIDIDSTEDNINGNDSGGQPDSANDNEITEAPGQLPGDDDEDDHDPERIEVYDLAMIKELVTINDPFKYGQLLKFDITVCNQGNEDATEIVVTDYLPAGYSFSFGDNPLWGGTTSAPTFEIQGTILQDQCTTFPIFLRIEQTTGGEKDWVNYSEITSSRDLAGQPRVDADSNNASDNPTENAVEPGHPEDGDDDLESVDKGGEEDDHDPAGIELLDLAIRKTLVSNGPFVYADIVEFEIEVFNQGSIEVTDIELTDHVPCGIIYMGTNDGLGWNLVGDVATLTLNTPLQPGNSTTVAFFGQLQECYDDEPNAWTNNVEVSDEQSTDPDYLNQEDVDSQSDDTLGNDKGGNADVVGEDDNITGDSCADEDEDDHDPELVPVYDLALQKRSTWMGIDSIGPFTLGDTVAFEIEIFNQGNIDAYQVEITDYQNVGYLFDQTLNTAWTKTGDLIQTTILGPLASGDSITLILNLTIDVSGDSRQGDWYNEAEVSQGRDQNGLDRLDADSTPDTDPDNDNDLVDGPDDDLIFNGDDNDEVIDEHIDDPFNIGDDDEDDNDAEEVLVIGGLGDFVWKDLNGNGLQDLNEPGVEGVVVIISDCDGNEIDRTVTDADGHYFFDTLLPGDYQLFFDISDLALGCAFTYQNVGNDDTIDSDVDLSGLAVCTTIEGGEFDSTFDAGLLILASIGDFVFEDLNGNGQQNFGEPGIEGVTVNLFNSFGILQTSTVTDVNGFYLFEYIYPGEYYLEFLTPTGYEVTFANIGNNDALDSDLDDANGPGTTQTTTLGPGENDLDWDAGFYRCVPIGELVWYDTNENDIYDTLENGINGLVVQLWKYHFGQWIVWDVMNTRHKQGTPSDDGYYKFCAPPGIYFIEVQLPPFGLVPAVANVGNNEFIDSDVTNANGLGTTNSFTVFSGEMKCDLGHGYYPQAQVGDRAWRDDNENGLQDSNELPMENVKVQAINSIGDVVAEAHTQTNGTYKLDYLGKDSYYLKFDTPNGFSFTTPNAGNDAVDSDVDNTNGYGTTALYHLNPGDDMSNVDVGFKFGGVVPVEWLSFTGESRGRFHKLDWSTANEINALHFEVERRREGESEYSKIGQVNASGTTADVNAYRFDDYDISFLGLYYYRLKQVDLDGKFNYSNEISLRTNKSELEYDLELYPNPAVDQVFVSFILNSTENISVSIWDADNQLVRADAMRGEFKAGDYEQSLDISYLLSGIYTLKLVIGDKISYKKLVVLQN